jgi:hypothetical protein
MTTISLRRYTTLPFLLDILYKKRLTFLNPKSWEDKNDSFYIELYKECQQLKSVLVLCFAEAKESYHHWKIYSGNSSGVCIEFKKEILLQNLISHGIKSDYVIYRTFTQFKRKQPDVSQLPFIKRYAFLDEHEFRAIYEDMNNVCDMKEFQIDMYSIEKIIFNPWIPESVFVSLRDVIRKIDGCEDLKVIRTTLTDNEKWKNLGRAIIPSVNTK